jgi:hypothetical protein
MPDTVVGDRAVDVNDLIFGTNPVVPEPGCGAWLGQHANAPPSDNAYPTSAA